MFVLFGKEGLILENKFVDVIEVLDLSNFKNGWMPIEFSNNAGVSLKKLINVIPLSNNLLLAYGAHSGRKNKKETVLINLSKFEIQKIDDKMRDVISCASKTSKKLKGIVSNLSPEDSKYSETKRSKLNNI